MTYEHDEILAYWEDPAVESMYDKHLLALEVRQIRAHIVPNSKILDAGCGEGEGTLEYSGLEGVSIVAADFSETRLSKAAERLKGQANVELRRVDFVRDIPFGPIFDAVISQRFLINLTDWDLQKQVLRGLVGCLMPGGFLLVLEGSNDGVRELNRIRELLQLPAIPVKWHNLFFDDAMLTEFMDQVGCEHVSTKGLGAYFLLTRGVRPCFERGALNWSSEFNALAATADLDEALGLGSRFSRLKLWVFRKR
jgi:ubiquinone/menaquinone biosynthesis C-methylase UbiE